MDETDKTKKGRAMADGWIKLYRKITEWEWYADSCTFHLFVHLILSANHEDKRWKGVEVKRGQLVTSLDAIKAKTGISVQRLRTALERLQQSGEIVQKTTNKYRIITICKYDSYQQNATSNQQTNNKQITNNQQTNNKQITTNKNIKNDKNERNNNTTKQKSEENHLDENGMKVAGYFFSRFGGSKLSRKAETYLKTALQTYTAQELVKVIDLAYDDPMVQNYNSRKSLSYILDMDRIATYLNNGAGTRWLSDHDRIEKALQRSTDEYNRKVLMGLGEGY